MAIKIAVYNSKGGVAKTTTSKCIAGELAKNHEKRVLLIDCDYSSFLSKGMVKEAEPHKTYPELIIANIDTSEEQDMRESIVPTGLERLDIAPIERRIAIQADNAMDVASMEFSTNSILAEMLEGVESEYDVIIMDVGAGEKGRLMNNALCAADYLVVPFEPSYDALEGFDNLMAKVKTIKRDNRNLKILAEVLVKYDSRSAISRDTREAMAEVLEEFIDIPVRFSREVERARGEKVPLCYYKETCNPAIDYKMIADEIAERVL